jgi:hypothetical protein
MKISSSAFFLVIYGVPYPITLLMNFWIVGPMTIAMPIRPMIIFSKAEFVRRKIR